MYHRIPIEFQYRSSFFEPINSMTRFIFLSSFRLHWTQYSQYCYLFPRISFFFAVAKRLQHELSVRALAHFEEKRASLRGIPSRGARCPLVSTIIDAEHVLSTFVTWSAADRHSHTSFPRFRATIARFTNVRIYRSLVTAWLDIYWARVSLLIGLFLWQLFFCRSIAQ